MIGILAYIAALFVLSSLCATLPFLGYPIAALFSLWLLIGRGGKNGDGRRGRGQDGSSVLD